MSTYSLPEIPDKMATACWVIGMRLIHLGRKHFFKNTSKQKTWAQFAALSRSIKQSFSNILFECSSGSIVSTGQQGFNPVEALER